MKKLIFIFILLMIPISTLAALININTASSGELENITGVGEVIAGRIIEYRNSSGLFNGLFKTIEEIKNVKGVGDATFLKMKDEITVGSVDTPIDDSSTDQNSDSSIDSSSTDNDSSVHSGETDLSDYSKETFKIGVGRDRLATVRTPIMFLASQNKKGKNLNYFAWSFGDGTNA